MTNAIALLIAGSALAAAADWVDLFNGKDLQGWVQKGGAAKYRAENGELVGTTVPNTGNSFLCTTKHYTNFPRTGVPVRIRN